MGQWKGYRTSHQPGVGAWAIDLEAGCAVWVAHLGAGEDKRGLIITRLYEVVLVEK